MIENTVKIKKQKFGIGSVIILQLFGTIFTTGGLFFMHYAKVDSSWIKTDAKVVDLVRRRGIVRRNAGSRWSVFEYSVNGQTYRATSILGKYPTDSIGEKIQIAYNPKSPDQAKNIESIGGWIFLALFPIFGIGAFILAPILFAKSLKK